MLFPGELDPQSIDVAFCVSPLSEYTRTPTDVTVPVEGRVLIVLTSPAVASVNRIPVIAIAIIAAVDNF
jgi:hypothetical protein